jgi:non-ribosomal peptide synthetase component F/acyl carrier protein
MVHPSRSLYEDAILAIWRDLLDRSDIGIYDGFFEVGGHSLLVLKVLARIRKTLDADIPVMDFFENPTVAALASAVAERSSGTPRMVDRRSPDAEPVLSFAQQRLWLEDQLAPGAAYNVHGRRRLVGPVDVGVLEASIRAILTRHEVLRTRFPTIDGRPIQVVEDFDEGLRIRVVNLTGVDGDREAAARSLLDEEATVTFDLAQGPLFRCLLVTLGETEHFISVTMHHIVSDAWSIALFVRELSSLYEAGGDVARADLPALPVQYLDFSVWQRDRLVGEELERQVSYWRAHLEGAPAALALPTAQRNSASRTTGHRLRSALSTEETVALYELCRKHGVTTFMALLAGVATVLGRWSGQEDVVIGVPIAGRAEVGTDTLIGFFVNTLPLRVDLSGEPTFADLLARIRQVALGGYAHAEAPFDVIVQELQATRDPRRTPLFQAILNVLESPEVEQTSGVSVEPIDPPALPSKFDLMLTAQEVDGVLQLVVDFDADRYQPALMQVLTAHLSTLLRAVIGDPTRGIFDYPLQETRELPAVARSQPVPHAAVARVAGLDPDRVAVLDQDGRYSYRWLEHATDRVAALLAERGTSAGEHVGVVRRPSAAFVAAVLGAGRVGATVTVVEAAGTVPARFLGVTTVLDVAPSGEPAAATLDLSPLFTEADADAFSGGDGRHAGDVPTVDWAVSRFDLAASDRFAVLSAAPGHLLSAVCTAVHAGAALVLAPQPATADPAALAAWLSEQAVSVVYAGAPVLRAMARDRELRLAGMRYIFVANSGELISHDIEALRRLAPASQVVALYRTGGDGRPLAVHTVPAYWQPETAPLRVLLGNDLPDHPADLQHPGGQPAAVGEVAELCFGTYHTGDLARRWPDGSLEFIGRLGADLEIDLVEAAAALRDMPEVHDALVTEHAAGTDGPATLLGYVTGPDPSFAAATIRQHLLTRLPNYLIPKQLFVLDELPLTPDGGYDLDALPSSDMDGGSTDAYIAPRTPIEQRLAQILEELLDTERVGVYDSFFELGGFSLLATQLTTRVRELFDVELSLRDVFASPTVDRMAQLIVLAQGEQSGAGSLEALLDDLEQAEDDGDLAGL